MRPIAILLLLLASTTGSAHYNMLLPGKPWANKGDKVTFTYQFGHPFEHELSDAPKPAALRVFDPRGTAVDLDLAKTLTAIKRDKATAWQFHYTPTERGDYTFLLKTARIKHDDKNFIEDIVRVVLHVQTQNGWAEPDLAPWGGIDLWPYTRPYGLLPGMVFRGRVIMLPFKDKFNQRDLRFVSSLPVEIEKYNPVAPKKLPPDELITFKTKVDSSGFFVATLPEPGWWGVTASTYRMRDRVIQRVTHWIHVDEKK